MLKGLKTSVWRGYRWLVAQTHPSSAALLAVAAARELDDLREYYRRNEKPFPADLRAAELAWEAHCRSAFDPARSAEFYAGWQGDIGYLNLIANMGDQFRRIELFAALEQWLPKQAGTLIDVGCGTAGLTLEFAPRFQRVVLVDVPNVAREFVEFKLERRALRHVEHQAPEALAVVPANSADVVVCIDVLEHLPTPSAVFQGTLDRLLKPEGLLILQAPWGGDVPEHLAEAPVDWLTAGGQRALSSGYTKRAVVNRLIERRTPRISAVFQKNSTKPA